MYLIIKRQLVSFCAGLGLLLIATCLMPAFAYAAPVGQIGLLEGSVTVTKLSGKRVFVAEGSNLEIGDVIVTGSASKAMLAFTDGGKIALRPNTVFQINRYSYATDKPEQDNALFQLLKGGLRTVTGLVGKRGNQNAYQLGNTTATIGIRGTEYMARVCDAKGCDEDSQKIATKPIIRQQPIARVVMLKGTVFRDGVTTNQEQKHLVDGDGLYLGDTLTSIDSSQVGILFTDGTRIVLPSNTVFKVDSYQYAKDDQEKDTMLVRLFKGSARVITGLVGKRNPGKVKYATATATIGIRGTNFDISCVPTGAQANVESNSSNVIPSGECDKALATTVNEGAVDLSNEGGSQSVEVSQSAYADSPTAKPTLLSSKPKLFADDVVLPESLSSDTEKAFGTDGSQLSDKGMFVTVIEGKVIVQQQSSKIDLGVGESGFASSLASEGLSRLSTTPESTNFDPSLKAVKFDSFSCGL